MTTLLLAFSPGTGLLLAQNVQPVAGTLEIKGSHTKVSSSLRDATMIINITSKNVDTRKHDPITVIREVDAASPKLYEALSTNEALQEVVLKVYKPGDPKKYKIVTLQGATISKISKVNSQHSGGQNDTHELEEISFTFAKITFTNVMGGKSATDDWLTGNR